MVNKRVIFTQKIVELLQFMIANGDNPVIDYCLRSKEEQLRLFSQGRKFENGKWIIVDKSKVVTYCDGYNITSKHNLGLAVDIYLTDNKGNILFNWNIDKANFYHKKWKELGGKSLWLEKNFDAPHFEL